MAEQSSASNLIMLYHPPCRYLPAKLKKITFLKAVILKFNFDLYQICYEIILQKHKYNNKTYYSTE